MSILGVDGMLRLQQSLPAHLIPTARQERALIEQLRSPPDALPSRRHASVPCLHWNGGARVRYNGRRWQPRRLFYALGAHDGARRLKATANDNDSSKRLEVRAVCGSPTCVEPRHLQLNTAVPPVVREHLEKKAKVNSKRVADEPDEEEEEDYVARARKRMRQAQETLARIEAVRATFPPELRDTPAAYRAEREAMVTPEELAELRRTGRPLPRDEVVFMFVDDDDDSAAV